MEPRIGGRVFNAVIGLIAVLLGIYMVAAGGLGLGFGGSVISLVYIFGGVFVLGVGISLLRNKPSTVAGVAKPHLGRAVVLGLIIFIGLMWIVPAVFDF